MNRIRSLKKKDTTPPVVAGTVSTTVNPTSTSLETLSAAQASALWVMLLGR